jgi:hypothetical protein
MKRATRKKRRVLDQRTFKIGTFLFLDPLGV